MSNVIVSFKVLNGTNKIISSSDEKMLGLTLDICLNRWQNLGVFTDITGFSIERLKNYIEYGNGNTERRFLSKTTKDIYSAIVKVEESFSTVTILRHPSTESKNKKRLYFIGIVSITLIILLASITIIFLQSEMRKRKNEEATALVLTISSQIENNISLRFASFFNDLEMLSVLFDDYNNINENETEINKILDNFSSTLGFLRVGVMLNDGELYFSSNNRFRSKLDMYEKLIINKTQKYVNTITINEKNYIIFGYNANKNADSKIVATCGILDETFLHDAINIEAFGKMSSKALIKSDGYSIIKDSKNSFLNYANFFDFIKIYKGDSELTKIKDAFLNGESGMISINEQQQYYLYYSPLKIDTNNNAWYFVLCTPVIELYQGINSLFKTIMVILIIAFLGIVLIVGVTFFLFLNKKQNDLKLKNQIVLNEGLARAMDSEIDASKAKTAFFSNVSHDIRTPINGIIGMTAIALKHSDEKKRVEDCLHKIDDASSHLLSLINDVLDMSRIENERIVINKECISIKKLLDECIAIIDGELSTHKLNFNKNFIVLDEYIMADKLHLSRVLINILGNAVKYTDEGGMIEFKVLEELSLNQEATFHFIVKDNGCGMSEQFLKRLFEPFAQENKNNKTNYSGSGLGLTIAFNLVHLMGGKIDVLSKLGVGSTFEVTIPFELANKITKDKNNECGGALLKGKRILVAEDNEINREIMRVLLEEEGIIVDEAKNGKEAVDKFEAHIPNYYDAILMDIMMPCLDGYEATRRIRASSHPNALTIPIIAMTANAFKEDIKKTLSSGMNAHLSKPVRIEDVLELLKKILK